MTSEPHHELVQALERFLDRAGDVAAKEFKQGGPQGASLELAAQSLAGLSECHEADSAARRAAVDNAYQVSAFGTGSSAKTYGRPLDAGALVSTGIVGMLVARANVDRRTVAEQMAGYLGGPPVGVWDYVILDGNLGLDAPVQLADGWELVTPSAEDLRMLLPVPATAAYQPQRPFAPKDYGGLTMLRRFDSKALPDYGPALYWDVLYALATHRTTRLLWQPLLALNLFDNQVLRLWAWYKVEPGRRTDKLFDSVDWEVWTPDGVTDIDRPMTGSFGDNLDVQSMRRFMAEVSPLLGRAVRKKKAGERLRRCAEHFLSAGDHAHGEGDVLGDLNAEAVLQYIIALEGLLTGSDTTHGELTRKVSQRAAVLAGENDAERLEVERLVRTAYGARSAYAHGSDTSDQEVDLPRLRQAVRRCLLSRLVLGDPQFSGDGPLDQVADHALLSHEVLDRCIHGPLSAFMRRTKDGG
jgi:hypothetical protein